MQLHPTITTQSLKKRQDTRPITVFTSPSADEVSKPFLHGLNIVRTVFVDSVDRREVEALIAKIPQTHTIYAVGGGRVCDVARYAARTWDAELYIIPTVISSDAFLVDCSGLRENGCVTYIPAKMADEVVIDWNLLLKSPYEYHVAGCGDVLSIYTGLHDWKAVNEQSKEQPDEAYSIVIAHIAQGILDGLLQSAELLNSRKQAGIEALIIALAMEVALCNLYGNSRPEEGGEHFFAYCAETKLPHSMHGEMVGFGILITSLLQGQDWKIMYNFMDTVGFKYLPSGLTRSIVMQTLGELPQYVIRHQLRRSIYNDFDCTSYTSVIDNFLLEIGVNHA